MRRQHGWWAICFWLLGLGYAAAEPLHGIRVEPPRLVSPQQLIDQDGRSTAFPLRLSSWQLVIFGYTNCPDVCPMTLHKTAQLLETLGRDSDRVRIVFVSIDGSRDDAQAMKEFVGKFDPRIVGLTGDAESLQGAANAFDVLTRRYQGKTALAFTLVHSSLIYVLDPAGRLRMLYPGNTPMEVLAKDLRQLWARANPADHGLVSDRR